MTQQGSPHSGQRLCKACGLCCKGVWFHNVPLAQEEVPKAHLLGLTVTEKKGRTYFLQPCSCHVNGSCSAYGGWRPDACVTYSCALLDRLQAGEVTEEVALSHATAAREMADRISAETGPIEGGLLSGSFLDRLSAPWEPDLAEANTLSAGSRMDAVALRVYFDRYFKNESSEAPVATSDTPASLETDPSE